MAEASGSVEPSGSAGSIAFDRAADYYDRTRAMSPGAERQMVALLSGELRRRGPCLEIGVGTGRIALPLHAAGVELVGVDLARPMLERLGANAGGQRPFPVVQGDATRLPFADRAFGAGLATHVLHLVASWRDAVDELIRVVRPGGMLAINSGGWHGLGREIGERIQAELGDEASRIGLQDHRELDEHMAVRGARSRELPPVIESVSISPEWVFSRYESHQFSWTWTVDADELRRAADHVRRWARAHYGDLDEERPEDIHLVWRAYDLR